MRQRICVYGAVTGFTVLGTSLLVTAGLVVFGVVVVVFGAVVVVTVLGVAVVVVVFGVVVAALETASLFSVVGLVFSISGFFSVAGLLLIRSPIGSSLLLFFALATGAVGGVAIELSFRSASLGFLLSPVLAGGSPVNAPVPVPCSLAGGALFG